MANLENRQDSLNFANTEENYFVNAIHQEIFNRIFPSIRHEMVGFISASLMRVSIMDRYLNREGTTNEQLTTELRKIEGHLKEAVQNIRELKWWDFDSDQKALPSEILKNSVRLISSQLAMRGIELSLLFTPEDIDTTEFEMKPLMYSLLCLFCYFEDNHLQNSVISISSEPNTLIFKSESLPPQVIQTFEKNRELKISSNLTIEFAKSYDIEMSICSDLTRILL